MIVWIAFSGNAVGAFAGFALEGTILTVRLLIYYNSTAEQRENSWGITPEKYKEEMLKCGCASLGGFVTTAVALKIAAFLSITCIPSPIIAIAFGFIGYVAVRWLSNLVFDQYRYR